MLRFLVPSVLATTLPVAVATVLAWPAFGTRGHLVFAALLAAAGGAGVTFALLLHARAKAAALLGKRLRRAEASTTSHGQPPARGAVADATRLLELLDAAARETKLLAINATLEAARAGDAGRTFATMADDLRARAHRTSELARDAGTVLRAAGSGAASGR